MNFDLARFELNVYRGQTGAAAQDVIPLLALIDRNYGSLAGWLAESDAPAGGEAPEERDARLAARLTSALIALFTQPQLKINAAGFRQILEFHAWLNAVFAASPMANADHVLRALASMSKSSTIPVNEVDSQLLKSLLLYGPESELGLDWDRLWSKSPQLAAGLALSHVAPRYLGSPIAHARREALLPWLAQHLDALNDLDVLPPSAVQNVYMHCSYAERADKHDIKRPLNRLVRSKLAQHGLAKSMPPPPTPAAGEKPVLLAVLERFDSGHSIYRTHSLTLEAARAQFRTVGVGRGSVDGAGRAIFDEFVELVPGTVFANVAQVRELARRVGAHVLYMPSVGMDPLCVLLATIRIAPLQVMALGHPATTHSPEIDYVVVEEDYVGDLACFSERLLLLPRDAMPYRQIAATHSLSRLEPARNNPTGTVRVAVLAAIMKINPGFLLACARIASEAGRDVHFEFMPGLARGLTHAHLKRVVHHYLGDRVTVHPHQPFDAYLRVVGSCDLFINPFPFGNTNGIVDAVSAGLVGVCRTGREVHEHIDEGLFRRLGFPDWTIASTTDHYVDAAVRLIRNDDERSSLRSRLTGPSALSVLFEGRQHILGERLLELSREAIEKREATV